MESHQQHIQEVLHHLQLYGLFAKLKKCEFHSDSVEYLGYCLSPEGLMMSPDKIQTISDWPEPQKVKDIQSFLGFANFYISKVTIGLNSLTVSGLSGIRQLRWISQISQSSDSRPDIRPGCLTPDGQTTRTVRPVRPARPASLSDCQTVQTTPDQSDHPDSKSVRELRQSRPVRPVRPPRQ